MLQRFRSLFRHFGARRHPGENRFPPNRPRRARGLFSKTLNKSLVNKKLRSNWVGLTVVAVLAFSLTAGAIQDRQQTQQTGTRSSGLKPKRPTQNSPTKPKGKAGLKSTNATTAVSDGLSPILATADFDLTGLAITVGPASLTVPKNTPTFLQTSVNLPVGTDPATIISELNPNYRVRGELTGPSLTSPLVLEAPIGQPLSIPGLSNAGDHVVRNLRVVDIGTPDQPVVTSVNPDSVGIVVIERLLISQVQVNELSYDQIIQAGINITDDSYRAFNFTLGVATESTPQTISIPVAFPSVGVTDPRPLVGIPSVSSPGIDVPTVVPVMLTVEGPDGQPSGHPPGFGEGTLKIPGVVVFPGRVGFLHQFFEAIVIVANGAPNGAPLVIHTLKAKAHLPDNSTPADASDDPLRIAETQTGGRVDELQLHGLGPDGKYGTGDDTSAFAPSESGQATFLIEGLKEGLHEIDFDLEAMLEGLPGGPVKVRGEVSGAVLVRDASFAVTFTHPSVVRAGTPYDLGMTIYNSGPTDIQGAFARLPPNSISGAAFDGPDTGQRQFATTIKRGESATVKWHLKATVTGEVTASYVKVGDGVSAGLTLVTGVGDRNIPLSPDSLILPEPVRHLPSGVVEAGRALLGQGWSIANAPPGSLPPGVTKVTKQTVVNRAVELGIAGMRVDFGEPVSVSLDTVLRDWLGELQSPPDPGFADTQRNTLSGYDWFDSIGAEYYKLLNATNPVTAVDLHREFANTEVPRSRFISALVTQSPGDPIVGSRFIDSHGKQVGFGATPDDRDGDLAQGGSLRLLSTDLITGAVTNGGEMLVVSNAGAENWTLELSGWRTGVANLSLIAPTSSIAYGQYVWNVIPINEGGKYRVRFKPLNLGSTPLLEELVTGAWQPMSATASVTTLSQPAPRVVGVIQVTPDVVAGGDKYGRLVGILFSKPMDKTQAQTISRYKIGGGVLRGSNPAQQVGDPIGVTGARIDYGNRFVFLSLNSTIGPYIERDLTVSTLQDTKQLPLAPSPTTKRIEPRVSPEGNPPGAYLTGRVLNADGTPIVNAPVIFWAQECPDPSIIALPPPPIPIVLKYTNAQGRYEIDYVRDGDCAPLNVSVNNPLTHSEKRLTSAVAYDGQHMVLDMVFLARGNVEGNITSGGQLMPRAFVRVVPDLDVVGTKVVQADEHGHYVAADVPVGNISVLAVGAGDAHNASGFAAGTITGAGQTAFINVALQNIQGVVRGHVYRADQSPSAGALVVAYENIPGFRNINRGDGATPVGYAFADRDGSFAITSLPIGTAKLEVTDYVTGLLAYQTVQLTTAIPEVNGIVITLPGNGYVSGRVTDDVGTPLANVLVSSAGRAVLTDSLGNYTLSNLPAGTAYISAYDAATQRAGSAQAPVSIGQTTSGINIVILRPSTLQGTVYVLREGTTTPVPASGIKVSADGYTIVETDSQGHYTITGVPSGDLIMRFVDIGKGFVVNTPVKLLPGETLTRDATFKPGTIHGKVFQPDGVTGAIAQVSIYAPHPEQFPGPPWGLMSSEPPFTTQSAADGSYSISGIMPGTYRVTTSSVFFPTRVSAGGTLAPSGNDEVNLTLVSTLAGKIQGNVFLPDGSTSAGPGIRVTLSGGSLAEVTVRTDENGHYEFAEVFSAGGYALTATDPVSGSTNRINVSVERNKDAIFNLRLLGTGAIRVHVQDGAGQPVQGGSVTLDGTDYPNPHRFSEIIAGSNGLVTFNNLPEGSYAISATQHGLGGRTSAIVSNGASVDVTVQLQATGNIEGHVYMPDGVTPISLADVQLRVGGRSVGYIVTSEEPDIGKFTFINVPTGDFTLDAFDNHTGRVGRAAGSVTEQGQTAVVNVLLLPVGAVRGRVTANGVGVDHAGVSISADGSGVRGANLFATTDPDGNYRFTGIPAGRFVVSVSDAPGGQTGSVSGTVSGTVEPLPDTIANVALEPSQTVTGTVFQQGGTVPAVGAQVTITVAGRVYHTATNDMGVYALGFVALGDVRVRAESAVGYDRGESAVVTGTQAGATLTANVTLSGVGTISGEARDNNGAPLSAGTVTFTNDAWSPPVVLFASVQPNGHYEIAGAPAGPFSLRLTVPGRVGVGSASGAVVGGQTTNVTLQLEDAGAVTGTVTTADGNTPVQGASIAVTLKRPVGGWLNFYTHTNAQGIWTLPNVPLGIVDIAVVDEVSGGIARARDVALATNGATVDIGILKLDNTTISVASVNPANGTTAVATNGTVITVTFSEPAQASTVNSGTVQLQLNNSAIGTSLSLSSDGLVATLTPLNRLAESATYKVYVNLVEDRAGLRITTPFTSTFTTADETAPTVSAISPVSGATEVPANSSVVVTFNEAIDSNVSLNTILIVASLDAPQTPLAGNYALDATGRIATFTPNVVFADSTRYTITVNGQRDPSGNIQTQATSSTFSTQDRVAPIVDPLPIDGTTVRQYKPPITATYHDDLSGIKTSTVVLTVDNVNVTAGATVTGSQLSYTPAAPLAGGHHTVTVQVADNSGNVSLLRTAAFDIDDSGPVVSSFTIGGAPAVDGMFVTSSLQPVFAVACTDDTGINISQTKLLFAPQGSPLVQVAATVTQTGLTYQPPSLLAEGQYAVQAILTNNLGTTSTTGVINFTLDVDAPEIATVTPSTGSQHGGTTVVITGQRLFSTTGAAPTVTIGGNPTQVTAAVAGSPDQVTIITPAGAPGPATIRMSTNRGTGVRVGGFNYDADPRTPFVTETDSILLYHLDETLSGATRINDSGTTRILYGTSGSSSQAQGGRFAGGRTLANIASDSGLDVTPLKFPSNGFTLECWVKTGVVGRTYALVGKEDQNGGTFDYSLRLLPSGILRAMANDATSAANKLWKAELSPATLRVDDNQWHYLAMVVDRTANRLSLYVDGIERANAVAPAGFTTVRASGSQFRVGHWAQNDPVTTGGGDSFPGLVDEVRVSSTAHPADQIQKTYLGTEGTLGITITNSAPLNIGRGSTTEVQLLGYNLAGTVASVTGPAGTGLTAAVLASSATQARVQLSAASDAALGDAQLVISSSQGSATLALRVIDLSLITFAAESDTRLLWHLNETGNGAVTVFDETPIRLNGTAGPLSTTQPGRFAGGRGGANLQTAGSLSELAFGSSSFTVEGWVKTDPVGRTYTLFGKEDLYGYYYGPPEYAVRLYPSGTLRALAYDSTQKLWLIDLPANVYRVDDNQWHYVAMVVDRSSNKMSLFVDGFERAWSNPPANFSAITNQGHPFRAGHWAYYEQQTTGGPEEFPGVVDEIRVSATAHSAARILDDLVGTSPMRVTSYDPKDVLRQRAGLPAYINQITVNGYNLEGVTARLDVGGHTTAAVVGVSSSSYHQAVLSVDAAATVPLGNGEIVLSKAGQADVAIVVRIGEQAESSGFADTILLWNLNESGNGAVPILDAGALGINGTASTLSQAQPGHFGGGRTKANIISGPDNGALLFGSSSFTVECWFKTGVVGRTYTLAGKEDLYGYYYGPPEYTLRLLPSGGMRALLYDTSQRQWKVEVPRSVYQVDDNQWHHAAMVVDRLNNRLSLYIDGVERGWSPPPTGFSSLYVNGGGQFRAGKWSYYDEQTFGGPEEFPGVLDDIRVSASAHTAAQIVDNMNGVPGLRVNSYSPQEAARNKASGETFSTVFSLAGFGLDGVSVSLMRNGQPLDAMATVESSSFNQAQIRLSINSGVATGTAQLVLTKPGLPAVSLDVRVFEKSELATDVDTRLLWHLNETGNGAIQVVDSGPLGLSGTASNLSLAQPGHFDGARRNARVIADNDFGALNFGVGSFTAECWFKTPTLGRTYTLVGKEDLYGYYYGPPEFSLRLLPSGGMRALAYDTSQRQWKAEFAGRVYDPATGRWRTMLDDNLWHHAAMVVDRANNKLSLYVDGVERASAPAPAGFSSLYSNPQGQLRAGKWSYYDESTTGGNEEFPGLIDEVRVSSSAHTPERVLADALGTDTPRISLTQPSYVQRGLTNVPLSFTGYGLANATVTTDQINVGVSVVSSSSTQLNCLLTVPANTPVGELHFSVTVATGQVLASSLTIVDQQPFINDPSSNSETLLLWHLDEPGNGAVHINGSGDVFSTVIGGNATSLSQAQAGRFSGARAKANIVADANTATELGLSSFTLECWVKPGTIGRTYTLVGREDIYNYYYGPPSYGLKILPTGGLRAIAYDTTQKQWKADMPGRTYDPVSGNWQITVNDGQWHYVAMVVDRANNKMTLYADGVERASAVPPAGFGSLYTNSQHQLRVGKWSYYDESTTGGNEEFPGTIDEVRILKFARSSAQIADTWFGTSTAGGGNVPETAQLNQPPEPVTPPQPQMRIDSITPGEVLRDRSARQARVTTIGLHGVDLGGGELKATIMRDRKTLDEIAVRVVGSSDTDVSLSLSVAPNVPLGPAQLVLSKPGYKEAIADIRVIEPGEFAVEADTVGLWHLDEQGDGAVRLLDSTDHGISLATSQTSRAAEGRFGSGRVLAHATAEASSDALNFGAASFTVETWVKTDALDRDYVLVGKETNTGQNTDFSLKTLSSGALRAELYDSNGVAWQAETLESVADGKWHSIALVVDRETGSLSLYIDTRLQAATPLPVGFSGVRNLGQPLEFGCAKMDDQNSAGREEFPGALDEIRISSTAHRAEKISADFFGHDEPLVTLVRPALVRKGSGPAEITLSGYGLAGAVVTSEQRGVTLKVISSTATTIRLSVSLSDSIPVEPILLKISDVLGRSTPAELGVAERLVGIRMIGPSSTGRRASNLLDSPTRLKTRSGAFFRPSGSADAKPVGGQR